MSMLLWNVLPQEIFIRRGVSMGYQVFKGILLGLLGAYVYQLWRLLKGNINHLNR